MQTTKFRLLQSPHPTAVAWFRNDLRILDNQLLNEAKHFHRRGYQVVCVYCFDPRQFGLTRFGSPKCGCFRTKFLLESVENLRKNLKSLSFDLYVTLSKPEDFFTELLEGRNNSFVLVQSETSDEERTVENNVELRVNLLGCHMKKLSHDSSLYNRDDLPFKNWDDMPDVFTPYLKLVEKECQIREQYPNIQVSELGPIVCIETNCNQAGYNYLPSLQDLLNLSNVSLKTNVSPFSVYTFANHTPNIPSSSSTASYLSSTTTSSYSSSNTTSSSLSSTSLSQQQPQLKQPQQQQQYMNNGYGYNNYTNHTTTINNANHIVETMVFIGGEDAALARLQKWMWDDDNLKDYFDIRNGMLGERYSTKLSPWLAHGCISPRYITSECKRYEKERIANKSTYWLQWQLCVRDFYRFLNHKYGNKIFHLGGIMSSKRMWNDNPVYLQRWKDGLTGIPIVDANMREVKQTGFMSNRGRQIVASYLVYELGIDWRYGADHFESLLLDHDVYSNYGSWNMAAGLTGGRINRFNMAKQSRDNDPLGDHIHYWIPELKNVPAPEVYEPWLLTIEKRRQYGVEIDNFSLGRNVYPLPISH